MSTGESIFKFFETLSKVMYRGAVQNERRSKVNYFVCLANSYIRLYAEWFGKVDFIKNNWM